MRFFSYLPAYGLLSMSIYWLMSLIKFGKNLAIVSSSIFFLPHFSFLSLWHSNYIYVRGLDFVPQISEALFILLLFSSINASGWKISIDITINSLFLYLLCPIHTIVVIEKTLMLDIYFLILGFSCDLL